MDDPSEILSFEDDGSYWLQCWSCGGAGCFEDDCTCGDDCCCCLDPEPPTCSECHGKGAFHIKPHGKGRE